MQQDEIARLTSHWLFAGVPEALLAPLLAASRVVRFLPGEEIFDEGDDSDGLYFIVDGTVRIVARGRANATVLTTLQANEIFGEMGALDGEQRSGLALAVSVCTLFFLPSNQFLDLLEHSSLVCNRLLILLAQRLRGVNSRLAELPSDEVTRGEPVGEP
jgi:CRP-like cAMP-binding protein